MTTLKNEKNYLYVPDPHTEATRQHSMMNIVLVRAG